MVNRKLEQKQSTAQIEKSDMMVEGLMNCSPNNLRDSKRNFIKQQRNQEFLSQRIDHTCKTKIKKQSPQIVTKIKNYI